MAVQLEQIMIIVTMRLVLADDVENFRCHEGVLTNEKTMKMVTDRHDDTCNFTVFFNSNDKDYDN